MIINRYTPANQIGLQVRASMQYIDPVMNEGQAISTLDNNRNKLLYNSTSFIAFSPLFGSIFDWGGIAWDSGLWVVSGLMLLHQLTFWGHHFLKQKYAQNVSMIESADPLGEFQEDLLMGDDVKSSFAQRNVDAGDTKVEQVELSLSNINTLDQCPNCSTENSQRQAKCSKCHLPLVIFKDKYRFEKMIGEGGMGMVYLAQHLQLEQEGKRVIKVIQIPPRSPKNKNDEIVARLEREIQTLQLLCNKEQHIVRIYDDFGFVEGVGNCYVMEHLEGGTLEDLIKGNTLASIKRGRVSYRTLFKIIAQICKGMQSVHEKNIVHRDLKPANIFLTSGSSSEPNFVKIIDFGITKWVGEEAGKITARTALLGTPLYMAPEQMTGGEITNKTDIYALGIIFFEMFTGKHPLLIEDLVNARGEELIYRIVMLHVAGERIPMTKRRPDLPELAHIDPIIKRVLDPKPENRFSTVGDFFSALREGFRKLPRNKLIEVNPDASTSVFGAGFDKTPSIRVELERLKSEGRIRQTMQQHGHVAESDVLKKIEKTLTYFSKDDG
ncbi:MAG: serine/threonine-protein kinase [Pseudomonadota bacterium]